MLKHVYRKQQSLKNYNGKPDTKRVFSVDGMAVLNCEVWVITVIPKFPSAET
jgi:hypothetical protein